MYNLSHPVLNKRSIFKVYNTNKENFVYVILAALYSKKIPRKSYHFPSAYNFYKNSLNLKNITLPMTNKNIPSFIKDNARLDISIRLFDSIKISENDMHIYETKVIGRGTNIINILFHKIYKRKKTYYVYFWIKNINSIKRDLKQSYVCMICYERFSSGKALKRHSLICNSITEEKFPKPKTFLSYDNKKAAKFASPISIIGFADFEAKLIRMKKSEGECKNNVSSTIKKDLHNVISYSLIFIDILGNLIFEKNYCGENIGENFFETLDNVEEKLLLTSCKNKEAIDIKSLSFEDFQKFNSATRCDICHTKFDKNDRLKCKNLDHCHYTNKFRSASCTMCNLLNRSQNHIPIYFHNFAAYDSKLLLSMISKNTKIRVAPKCLFTNLQKIRTLTYNSYKFKDSIEHLPLGLRKLVEELNNPNQNHSFPILNQSRILKSFLFKNDSIQSIEKKLKLLTIGKGIYPYTLCGDSKAMKKIKKIPDIKMFLMI